MAKWTFSAPATNDPEQAKVLLEDSHVVVFEGTDRQVRAIAREVGTARVTTRRLYENDGDNRLFILWMKPQPAKKKGSR
jgi:hypothetical protein